MPLRPLPPVVLLVVLALAACGGGDDQGATGTTTTAPPEPAAQLTLYYLEGEFLRAFPAEREGEEVTPADAVEALLANGDRRPSEIPPGTELNGVVVDGGTATVDLSRDFESGGGSLSMQARVAQVVYTLTQWPELRRVTIELDGEPVEAIGGEGVPARGLTRDDVANVLPPIFVDPPLRSSTSPLHVAGSASVYEANVSLRLEAGGDTLATGFATAAEGGPARGDFETTLAFEVDAPTDATLVLYEQDAAGGGEAKAVRVPVRLCPAGATTPC